MDSVQELKSDVLAEVNAQIEHCDECRKDAKLRAVKQRLLDLFAKKYQA